MSRLSRPQLMWPAAHHRASMAVAPLRCMRCVMDLQSVGQLIGEVLKQLDEDRFIVKASSGPRWVVGVRTKVRGGCTVPCCTEALL